MMKNSQKKMKFFWNLYQKDHGEHTESNPGKTIDSAWDILDVGLADRRKIVNEQLLNH